MSLTALVIHNRYLIQKNLKQEKYEQVFLVEDQQQNNELCRLTKFIGKNARTYQRELDIFTKLQHSQIENFRDFFEDDEGLSIIQSNIEGQSYADILKEKLLKNKPLFSEYEVVQLLNKILPVLSYLHNHNVTHRNISPSNLILREHDKMPVLVNFGLMQEIRNQVSEQTNQNESPILGTFDPSRDLQELAVTALILLTGKERQYLFKEEAQTWVWEDWKTLSDQRSKVLKQILARNPNSSILSANAVLQALNTTLPVSTTPVSLPKPVSNLMWGVGGLVVLAGILAILPSPSSITTTHTPMDDVDEQQFQCPSGSDIVAIACKADVLTDVQDKDSGNFDGGKLTVKLTKNGKSDDRLLIYNQGINPELIKVNKSDVIYQNRTIGSLTEGMGTTPLEVTFNSNADIEAVKTTVNSIVYQNLAKNPPQDTRTVEFQLTDGDGNDDTSQALKKVIGIHPVNSAPVLTIPSEQTVKEDSQLNISGISVQDNYADKNKDIIGVQLSVNSGTITIKNDIQDGVPSNNIRSGEKPGTVLLFGTINQINNTLKKDKAVLYTSNPDFNGSDTLTITAYDGGGKAGNGEDLIWPPGALDSKGDTKTLTIVVEPVNDAPILGSFSTTNTGVAAQNENSQSNFSRQDAVNLIQSWLEAKRVMFAPPYDFQPASELMTGEKYEQTIGAINSLKQDGDYYKYGVLKVESVDNFYVNGNQVIIQVKITEDRTLYDKNGTVDPNETDFKTRTVICTLEPVNSRYKIAATQILTK